MVQNGRALLLWGLVWYAIVQASLLCVRDRWQAIAPANEARKWPQLRQLAARDTDHPLVVMLGSSRTCWALRAGTVDGIKGDDGRELRVYNFGIPSTGPIHEGLYLRDMLAEGIRPRLLLVEVLPPLLCEPARGVLSEESTTAYPWLSARDLARMLPFLSRPGRRGRDWVEAHVAPWYAFRAQIHGELLHVAYGAPLHSYPAVDEWGWRIMTPEPLPAEKRAANVRREHDGYSPSLGHFHMGAGPRRALHELLSLCRREKIPAALVLMPESSEFRALYSDQAVAATRGLLDELSRRYGAPVVDANRWVADADFEDGHHVMAHGADVFTNRLREELPRLLAQLPPPSH